MDTLQNIKKSSSHNKDTYLAFLAKKKSWNMKKKNTLKITVFMYLHAKSIHYRWQICKRTLYFTVSLLLIILDKFYFLGESHQIWYFNCMHTATLIIKFIASFSSKNYVVECENALDMYLFYWFHLTDVGWDIKFSAFQE